jgi:2-amino-4-hydroxy-6-hydroxymethyldihydropteridine diphosphokinase
MPEVFVGAGSNADPKRALRLAVAELTRRFGGVRCSSVYRSTAVGRPAADYLNVVVRVSTDAAVEALREALGAIEALAGRSRVDPTVCALDLDLLLFGRRVDAGQRLPRPGLFTLPFVLGPLAELAPELEHPVTGERCRAVWQSAAGNTILVDLGALDALE